MEGTESKSWSMRKIATALKEKEINNVKIEVPTFQRNIVWNKDKREMFIDSVKKGFPVGSLLFYKKPDKETYTLIDGLQRSSTIEDFITNPTHYFSTEDIPDRVFLDMHTLFQSEASINDFKDAVSNEIKVFMSKQTDLNDAMLLMDLAQLLIKNYSKTDENTVLLRNIMEKLKPTIESFKKLYNDIAETNMPILVFSGDESYLPTVFERINNQGTRLSNYQIYAATWAVRGYRVIASEEIVKFVVAKYDAFTDEGYVLQDYDRDDILSTKELNIFEYVLGFGKYISEKYNTLFVADNSAQDINQIGFELLNACFGHHNKDIKTLDEEIHKVNDINKFQTCVEEAIVWVKSILKPIIEFKCNKRDTITYYHSHFQIIAMIATVFREKYDVTEFQKTIDDSEQSEQTQQVDSIHEKISWIQNEQILNVNIPQYYVYEILTRLWTDSGQGKIFTILNDNKYLTAIEKELWDTKLDDWFNTMLLYKEKKQVPGPKPLDRLFLSCIYMKEFTSFDQLSSDKFDIEHLATKGLLKKLIRKYSWEGLPISCIGNLCLLPEYDNRLKQENTIYKDENYLSYLADRSCPIEDIEKKYSFTKSQHLEWCYIDYKSTDYEVVKSNYCAFLRRHFGRMKTRFYAAMDIITKAEYDEALAAENKEDATAESSATNTSDTEVAVQNNE